MWITLFCLRVYVSELIYRTDLTKKPKPPNWFLSCFSMVNFTHFTTESIILWKFLNQKLPNFFLGSGIPMLTWIWMLATFWRMSPISIRPTIYDWNSNYIIIFLDIPSIASLKATRFFRMLRFLNKTLNFRLKLDWKIRASFLYIESLRNWIWMIHVTCVYILSLQLV